VIEHLGTDDRARDHFLRSCSINGALLALSVAGGRGGERELPLMRTDSDWDALADRLHELPAELEPAELTGLLDALELMLETLPGGHPRVEAQALAGAVLNRVAALSDRARTPISLSLLEAWLTVAGCLERRPPPPDVRITWAELLPATAPALDDTAALERFADWLALAELLIEHEHELLGELGFPGHTGEVCRDFLHSVADGADALEPRALSLTLRVLWLIERVMLTLASLAAGLRRTLTEREPPPPEPQVRPLGPEHERRSGAIDVDRVLRDL